MYQILYTNAYIWMKLFAGQQWRHRHREQTCGHGEGKEGEWDVWRE